jgi:hypothetical protein
MPRLADPRKLAAWRERFERFSKSGLAVGPFCEREGVSVASFYHWRKKLKPARQYRRGTDGHPRRSAGHRGTFRQVAMVPAGPGSVPAMPAICIQLPCGTRIEVGAEDLDALRTVVAEVVRADCGLEGVMPVLGRPMMRAGRGVDAASC